MVWEGQRKTLEGLGSQDKGGRLDIEIGFFTVVEEEEE